ncbi:hypothetical protein OGAPHI_000376 [Ogataea philodendri]|uniref:Uncharacterized protein n=1 Tax=Ogataea philodendri TaxID=1378263 RepID=A0A9P8TAA2_9ASCO|nr:uncharacterized protein OGAPHI_000376 [Ogataea philodendri]KAH3671671.1 hypothetical protein OGAPHI_000376 [Ogataea philodendri]
MPVWFWGGDWLVGGVAAVWWGPPLAVGCDTFLIPVTQIDTWPIESAINRSQPVLLNRTFVNLESGYAEDNES